MLYIFCALFIMFPAISEAALTTIDITTKRLSLNGRIDVLRDPTRMLTFKEVSSPERAKDFKTVAGRFSAGFTRDVVWLRFTLQKAHWDVPDKWLLEIYPPLFDYVTFYSPDAHDRGDRGLIYKERKEGRLLPLSHREIKERNFLFNLDLSDTNPHTYYLRLESNGVIFVEARLWEPQHFHEHSARVFLLQGGFYGITIFLFLLNLIFYFIMRDRLFIYYSLLLISLAVILSSITGFSSLYLLKDTPEIIYPLIGISLPVVYIAGTFLLEALIVTNLGYS